MLVLDLTVLLLSMLLVPEMLPSTREGGAGNLEAAGELLQAPGGLQQEPGDLLQDLGSLQEVPGGLGAGKADMASVMV